MTVLVLDTEAIEHHDVPAKVSDDKDRVPAAPHLRIVAACGVVLEARRLDDGDVTKWYEATRTVVFGNEPGASSKVILLHLAKAFAVRPAPLLVGYNSGGFDLRGIVAEAMEHGVQVPLLFSRDVAYRYSREGHEDVQDTLSNYGAGRYGSQDAWARRSGLPGKMGVDGSVVKCLHAAGRHQEISDYCMCDAGQLTGVWERKEYISGVLTLEGYRRSAASLVALFERTPALRKIVEHERFDRAKFLLSKEG